MITRLMKSEINDRHPDIVKEEEMAFRDLMNANSEGRDYNEAHMRWSASARVYREHCAPIRAEVESEFS